MFWVTTFGQQKLCKFSLFQVIIYRNILSFIWCITILATNWLECYAEKLLIFSRKIHKNSNKFRHFLPPSDCCNTTSTSHQMCRKPFIVWRKMIFRLLPEWYTVHYSVYIQHHFSQFKTKWLTLLIMSTGSAFCTSASPYLQYVRGPMCINERHIRMTSGRLHQITF